MNEQFDAGRETYIDKLREENERMRKALKEIAEYTVQAIQFGDGLYVRVASWNRLIGIAMKAIGIDKGH